MKHRGVSSNTIASYRDTSGSCLLSHRRAWESPIAVDTAGSDAPFIGAFLEDLETKKIHLGADPEISTSRPSRSFFRYAAFEEPAHSAHIQRVLAIPSKRCDKPAASVPNQARD